jgi:16S rRNA (uracil1498-N3)-methyltransferase
MSLPLFFSDNISSTDLNEETSRHILQVLRMQEGELLRLTDGKGNIAEAEIVSSNKKHCSVRIVREEFVEHRRPHVTIAISLVKNASRFEWFVEKATELGVSAITPLICERTERQKFRHDRFLNICKSAMLQSMQVWMPELHDPTHFKDLVSTASQTQRFIAHCAEGERRELKNCFDAGAPSYIILIGPEGDFTPAEISLAIQNNFHAVALGPTRLRTETAGVYASVVMTGNLV